VSKRTESANLIGFLAFQNGFTLAIGNDRKIAQKDRPLKKASSPIAEPRH